MKYRVRLNEVLYFARFEEIEIVTITDHAPGYIDGAALFDSKKSAQHVADMTCGTVVEVEEINMEMARFAEPIDKFVMADWQGAERG